MVAKFTILEIPYLVPIAKGVIVAVEILARLLLVFQRLDSINSN
jgi:hypothetical protein